MLDVQKEYRQLILKGHGPSLTGITKRRVGEFLVLEVDVTKAMWGTKRYADLTPYKRQEFEDLLYITNVASGNPKIIYSASII